MGGPPAVAHHVVGGVPPRLPCPPTVIVLVWLALGALVGALSARGRGPGDADRLVVGILAGAGGGFLGGATPDLLADGRPGSFGAPGVVSALIGAVVLAFVARRAAGG